MKFRHFLFALAATLLCSSVAAQTSQKPYMAGLSANFFDYQGLLTGDFTQWDTYNPGIAFAAYGYISDRFNYGLNTTFVPQVIYPTTEFDRVTTSMLDLKGTVRFNLLRPEAFFSPYIGTGFGFNTASNIFRMYVPATVGFRLNFTENFALQIESTYQQRIKAGDYQPLSHMAGFVFSLPSDPIERPEKEKPQRPEEAPIAELMDSDGDGVLDRDDQCPDVKGKAMYLGCPDPQTETANDRPANDGPVAYETPANRPSNATVNRPPSAAPVNPNTSPVADEDRPATTPYNPQPMPEPAPEDLARLNMRLQNIYFDYGSAELNSEALATLDEVAELMHNYPQFDLNVMGHADATGNDRTNIILSVRRAYQVKYYLVYQKNIRMARITSDGYSSTAPLDDNTTEDGRSKNRRVEFQLVNSHRQNGSKALPRSDR